MRASNFPSTFYTIQLRIKIKVAVTFENSIIPKKKKKQGPSERNSVKKKKG